MLLFFLLSPCPILLPPRESPPPSFPPPPAPDPASSPSPPPSPTLPAPFQLPLLLFIRLLLPRHPPPSPQRLAGNLSVGDGAGEAPASQPPPLSSGSDFPGPPAPQAAGRALHVSEQEKAAREVKVRRSRQEAERSYQ
eukprot:764670-Hanusia_phi.AAC.3